MLALKADFDAADQASMEGRALFQQAGSSLFTWGLQRVGFATLRGETERLRN